jgi:20S proteasome alpha/beta subunit
MDHAVQTKFGINLKDFYNLDVAKREPEILQTIKSVDLGAEFLIVYFDLEEAVFFRIEQSGYVYIANDDYAAIGSGEPLAAAIFAQIEEEVQSLPECLTWVYQAKVAAEKNPFVGDKTAMWILLGDKKEFQLSDAAWKILENTPGISLAKVDPKLSKLGKKMLKEYQLPD